MLDYLISNTKELIKYKSSVQFQPILLPVMQAKKIDKKGTKFDQPGPKKSKKGIFPPKEQDSRNHIPQPPPPPPGPAHRRKE